MPREPPKKFRILQHENRAFLSDWEEKYFQIKVDNKAHCLLCPVVISSVKSFNVERHYKIHSAKYGCYKGELKKSWSHLSQHESSKRVCSSIVNPRK